MSEAVIVTNEELAILCDIVADGAQNWPGMQLQINSRLLIA